MKLRALSILIAIIFAAAAGAQTDGKNLNLQANEQRLIQEAMQGAYGDTSAAAKQLGISEAALKRKLKEHPVSISQLHSKETGTASSINCVVHNLKFRVTNQVFNNSLSHCGSEKVNHVCCHYDDDAVPEGDAPYYYRAETGVLNSTSGGVPGPMLLCHQTKSPQSPLVEITWAVLEDLYGYDSIRENKIPIECRLGAVAR